MKKKEMWWQEVNWGRLTVVLTILPAGLNFMGMIWALVDRDWEAGFIMAAMMAVCVASTMVIWHNTKKEE